MPDLWKALGDVYGDSDPDAAPVLREAPASERYGDPLPRYGTQLPLDDDLAAALSAALVNAPTPAPGAAPLVPPAAAPLAAAAPAYTPPVAPLPAASVAPAAAVAPPAPVSPPVPVSPTAPAAVPPAPATPAPAPSAPAAHAAAGARVTSWIAEIENRNRRRDEGPDLSAVVQGPTWTRSDDDILPTAGKRRGRRG